MLTNKQYSIFYWFILMVICCCWRGTGMRISGRPRCQIARNKRLISSTKPYEPGKRYCFANQQHKLICPQKVPAPEEAGERLMRRR